LKINGRFGGIYLLNLQGRRINQARNDNKAVLYMLPATCWFLLGLFFDRSHKRVTLNLVFYLKILKKNMKNSEEWVILWFYAKYIATDRPWIQLYCPLH
jgi:hypothetical protein